jgi:hypothetical protein
MSEELILNIDKHSNFKNKQNYYHAESIISIGIFKMDVCSDSNSFSRIFWIIFNVFDQLLFFSPIFVFYLPDDATIGFILSTITAILMGIIVSMNVYILKYSGNLKVTIGSLFSSSTLSMISSMCASCSSVGFLLVSTFGGIGVTASTFLSNYQTPLRVVSIALLVWALYSASHKLTRSCVLNHSIGHGTKNL